MSHANLSVPCRNQQTHAEVAGRPGMSSPRHSLMLGKKDTNVYAPAEHPVRHCRCAVFPLSTAFVFPLPLRRVSTAFVFPLPLCCVSTAFVFPLSLRCVSTALVTKTLPLRCVSIVRVT